MSLSPGSRLGVYEITGQLGEGGMGQVYLATDTRLKRQVAIKILPPLDADPARLARFQREAEVLASLNHPNIAHVHGLEESSGVLAIVMELVEGEDLSQRLAKGAIPLDDALPIAKQIAEALEAAHEQGIVHRDLKPANIRIRPDGAVKVLDFGLAKATEAGAVSSSSLSMSPTLATPHLRPGSGGQAMTEAGMILGTAAYMSPEQARGTTADKRADLWAFGIVLWEMLTGTRLFEGPTVSDTLAAVLRAEPEWTALPAATPAPIRRLLRRCIEKDRKKRLDSAAAARFEIEEALSAPPEHVVVAASVAQPSVGSRVLTWTWTALTLGLAAAVLLLWAPWGAKAPARNVALKFTPFAFEQGGQGAPVWSPDGKAVAFTAQPKVTEASQVFVRYLDSPVATQITRLESDGVPIAWTSAGRIIFSYGKNPSGLWTVSPVGGEPEPLQGIDGRNAATMTRDGTALAWLHRADDGVFSIWVSAPPGSPPKPYEPAPFATRSIYNTPTVKFSPDGRQILLMRNGDNSREEAWLLPYPANSAHPPHRVFEGLPTFSTPMFSWMPDSRRVVISTTPGDTPHQLYLADTVSGTFSVFSSGTTAQRAPSVSPDGSKLIFQEVTSDLDVVSLDLSTAAVTPLITTQRVDQMPSWASRESALVYVTDRSGSQEIWLHKPGQADRPLVTARDFPPDTTQWFMTPTLSPDATRVIYVRIERNGPARLWMSAVAGGSPVRLVKSDESDFAGSWSPDGNWFVYVHIEKGQLTLNKVKTTGQAVPEVLQKDLKGSSRWVPQWSPAGDGILYGEGRSTKLMSTDGKTSREVSAANAVFGFSADGKTIYGVRTAGERAELFSFSAAGGPDKVIGSLSLDLSPASQLSPSLHLSLAPDGKSVTYSTRKNTSNLWLLEGLDAVALR